MQCEFIELNLAVCVTERERDSQQQVMQCMQWGSPLSHTHTHRNKSAGVVAVAVVAFLHVHLMLVFIVIAFAISRCMARPQLRLNLQSLPLLQCCCYCCCCAVVVCVAVCAIIVALPHLGAIEIGARAFRSMHFKLRMRKPWGGIKFGACCGLKCVALLFKL